VEQKGGTGQGGGDPIPAMLVSNPFLSVGLQDLKARAIAVET